MRCQSHPPGTLLCSCGYELTPSPLAVDLAAGAKHDWDQARLELEWNYWTHHERELYTDLFQAAKPHETAPLEAARWAAGRMLFLRPYLRRALERASGFVAHATGGKKR